MKVVFIASHSQQKDLGSYYKVIYDALSQRGHKVFSGSLFLASNNSDHDATSSEREKWYREVVRNVKEADITVVEISYPSTANVGHILTYALDSGKPVIALYKDGREPLFLQGRVDDRLTLLPYTDTDIKSVVSSALDYVSSAQDVRFNFFISPQIGTYLDWISKNKRIPRAVFLRKLIENEMQTDKDYEETLK
jgi:hypothetical protein